MLVVSRGSAKNSSGAFPVLVTVIVAVFAVPAAIRPFGRPLACTWTRSYRRCPTNRSVSVVPATGLSMSMKRVQRPGAGARTKP